MQTWVPKGYIKILDSSFDGEKDPIRIAEIIVQPNT